MRLRRITLRNYRGVDDRTVSFEPVGVTVVAGPNEIGKSSIPEALDLLIDHLDSSKRREVLVVKPVHRDDGAEIEAVIEAGIYRFTYFKRFHKRQETRLTVDAPTPESLTGREAHERALAILAETVDLDLWRALRIRQGEALSLPQLGENSSLSAALERSAGAARTDDGAMTLLARVSEEYGHYFTPTGRENSEVTNLDEAVAKAEQSHSLILEALRQVETDVERSRALEREEAQLRVRQTEDEINARQRTDELHALERRAADVERLDSAAATARALADKALSDQTARATLVANLASKTGEAIAAREGASASDPVTERAQRGQSTAAAALRAAQEADEGTAAALARREQDLQFRRDEFDLTQLCERIERIRAAEEAAQIAEQTMATSFVDEQMLAALRAGQRAADEARIRAEAGSPEVLVTAERAVTVRSGDMESTVAQGTTATHRALDQLVVEAPGVVRVAVRPAGDAEALRDALRGAEGALRILFERARVSDIAAAEEAQAARATAAQLVARRDEIVKQDLRDLTRGQLERKIASLTARVTPYLEQRRSVPGAEECPPDLDASKEALVEARRVRGAMAEALVSARRTEESARHEVNQHLIAVQALRTSLRIAERDAQRVAEELARVRIEVSDEQLTSRAEEATEVAAAARTRTLAARKELEATRPEEIRLRAAGALAAEAATGKALRAAQDEALTIRTRLQGHGQQGLAERCDAIETTLLHLGRQRDMTRRRAAAARLLFDTLTEKRDAARRMYVAPLRERIVRLGKVVFGSTFDVELAEDLVVVARTLDGRTVPFDSLSGGAREQIDLLTRVAAGLLVAEDVGVPLLFDDALGNSDAARTEALCAVLSTAGEHCQVIVLTCVPERYRHVARAVVVPLG